MNMVIVVLLVVICLLYFVALPVLKRRNMQNKQKALTTFLASLKIHDAVMLSDGILGEIIAFDKDIVQLKIADNVVIKVHKYAIASKD